MRLLHVLHQNPDGYPAGIEQYLTDLLAGPIGRRYECFLAYPDDAQLRLRYYDAGETRGVAAYPATKNPKGYALNDPQTEYAFEAIIRDSEPDIVHFQALRNLPLSLIEKAADLGVQTVLTLHDYFLWCIHFTLLKPDYCHFESAADKCQQCLTSLGYSVAPDFVATRRAYVGRLLARIDRLIFPSSYVQAEFLQHYPHLDPAQCVVIGNGIRVEGVRPDTAPALPAGPLRVGFLGNFLPHKGNEHFRNVLRQFQNRQDVEFHVFGNLYEPINVSAANLHVHGGYNRRQISRRLREAGIDIVLLLSIMPETFSYTLSEAMAAGIPVIATDLGALRQRITEQQIGFLVEYDNPIPRCRQIIEDLIVNPEILSFLQQNAARAATQVTTLAQMVEDHFRLYEGLQVISKEKPQMVPVG